MSDNIESKNPEFLSDLSDQEQENVTGGFNIGKLGFFFFQQTDIESLAERQTSISAGNGVSGASASRAGYRFSQTTLAFGSFMFGGMGRLGSRGYSRLNRYLLNLFGEDDWTG